MKLDEILRAQPATLPTPAPARVSKRFDYTGYMQRHPVEQVAADPLHDQLGTEWFDPEPAAGAADRAGGHVHDR